MAFSVKIQGIAKKKGKVLLSMEPSWWDTHKFINDDRFMESKEGGYLDYDADVSIEEMREIHEKFRPEANRLISGSVEWQKVIQPKLKELDDALYSRADEYSHFYMNVFEWESGYN